MPELVKRPRFHVGDKVRFHYGKPLVGTVTEARGTYNPNGHHLYRVYVPMEPEPLRLLLREDVLEEA
jgi:hypothetical protein